MQAHSFDHIVLSVSDVSRTLAFYQRVLGMDAREERPGKWSLHFGSNKISVQDAVNMPAIAENTKPGTANFCVLVGGSVGEMAAQLKLHGVAILDGPGERLGATGMMTSVYFHDPDGNLVEASIYD